MGDDTGRQYRSGLTTGHSLLVKLGEAASLNSRPDGRSAISESSAC